MKDGKYRDVSKHPDDSSSNTYRISDDIRQATTSWKEISTSGKNAIEASSTTYERNSRFALFVDHDYKNPDEFDNLVTKKGALYEMTVQPGEAYTIQGKERNEYVPGLDYITAFASQFGSSGPEGSYAPSGVTITQGYGDFHDAPVTSAAISGTGKLDGIPLQITEDDVVFGLYQGGELTHTKSLENGEWVNNPFEMEEFDFDITKFAVKRIEGNLYGSGSQNLYAKLRDVKEEKEAYIKLAEVSDPIDPAIEEYNLFNAVRVELDATADPFTFSVGPLQYFVEGNIKVPLRRKRSTIRDISISSDFTSTAGTVIAVYRKNPDNVECPIDISCAGKAQTDGRIEIREVHPDFVTFTSVDPTVDSNWSAPEGLRQRETGLQQLDMTVGDVTIATDSGTMRGEQASVVEYDGQSTGGGESTPAVAGDSERVNEFNYFVAAAKHQSTAENIERFDILTREYW